MAIDFFLYICTPKQRERSLKDNARIAQLVERNLAKVEVASSNLVSRSKKTPKAMDRKFQSLTNGAYVDLIPYLETKLAEADNIRMYIGSDSQTIADKTVYALVIPLACTSLYDWFLLGI